MSKQDELQEQFSNMNVAFFEENKVGLDNIYQRVGKIRVSILTFQKMKFGLPGGYRNEPKILISYPDNLIKGSWEKDFKRWSYENPNVTFTNFDSLKKYTDTFWDVFVMDEVHLLPDTDLGRGMAQEVQRKSDYVLGLSGTISKETQKNVKEWFGMKEIVSYNAEKAIEDGIVADYQVTIHFVELDNKAKIYKNSKGVLQTEKGKFDAYTWIIEKNKREGKDNMFLIIRRNDISKNSISKMNKVKELLSLNQNKRLLVFSGLSKIADSYGIPSYHSKTDDKALDDFMDGNINHIALARKGSTGVTWNNLDGVILSNFTSNEEELSQTISRAVLLDYGEKVADIHICCLNEPNEKKKLMNALSMLDTKKIRNAKQ